MRYVIINFLFLSVEETQELFDSAGLSMIGPGKIENRIMYSKLNEAYNSGLLMQQAYDVLDEARKYGVKQ